MNRTSNPATSRKVAKGAIGNHHIALYILIALLAAAPLWGAGMVNTRGGGDSPFLLQRTFDMAENLRYGIFPPRWMAHAAYDLGYPLFNHYAALPYYISSGLTVLGIGPIVAIQATQTLGFILAALTMALWTGRIYKSRAAALLAVVAYTFAPFHLVNIYVRGDSLSEFYAFIWYPLILWALDRVAARPTSGRIAAAALAYGALILSHNVSALIFSPFALLYSVVQYANGKWQMANRKSKPTKVGVTSHKSCFTFHASRITHHISRILAPFVLGFLLTAWFWLPAIAETKYGQMGTEFTEGYFHYSKHFRGLDLVQTSPAFNYSVATRTEEAGPFAMGLVQAGLTVAGAVILVIQITNHKSRINQESRIEDQKSRVKGQVSRFYLLTGLVLATVMITPLSKPLWHHLPLLEITQFPWRFLSVQALFTAIVTAALGDTLAQRFSLKRALYGVTLGLSVLIIASALFALKPDRLLITDEDVTWDKLLLYESFTGNIGTTIRYEYLPRDVVPRLYVSESVVDSALRPIADGEVNLETSLLERTPIKQVWTVSLSDDAPVAFPLNWWPGWQAKVGDTPIETYAMPGSGRLTVALPAGTHTLTLRLYNTPLRTLANAISIVTLAAGIFCWGKQLSRTEVQSLRLRGLFVIFLCATCAAALCILIPLAGQRFAAMPLPATFFDFHQMPYPHRAPVDFGATRLENVTLSETTIHPGDQLTVLHTWISSTPTVLTGTLRLVSPAEPRHTVPYALAETSFDLPCAGPCETQIAVPDDIARGLYLIQLRLYDTTARTWQGRGMGEVYVGAVRVPHGSTRRADAPVLHTFDDFVLHSVEAQQPEATTLRLKMTWSTAGTPRNWSLSLRLLDANGRQLVHEDERPVQYDLQPGYGYLPTSLWLPGEQVTDYPVLSLPEGLAPGDYTLHVIAYLQATMQGGGEIDVPIQISHPTTRYDLRDACCEQTRKGATILCQSGGIALLGLDVPDKIEEGGHLDFYAEWNAVNVPAGDVSATWDFVAPGGSSISRTRGPLAPGSSTESWPRHTWVRVPVHLDLPPQLSEGAYRLNVTLHNDTLSSVTCDLSHTLTVEARPRVFTVPEIPQTQCATFGESISLLGYDVQQQTDTLELTLWWRAQTAAERDYKRFVHVYDPDTEYIFVQDDAMPRAWTYPTTWWLAGEIVSETIRLDLSTIPDGAYHIAVGWYNPETSVRLPASTPDGQSYPMDRVPLNVPVKLGK